MLSGGWRDWMRRKQFRKRLKLQDSRMYSNVRKFPPVEWLGNMYIYRVMMKAYR